MSSEKLLFRLEQPHGFGDIYIAWQKGSGNYLATTGVDSAINIFDRHGDQIEQVRLNGLCAGFGWDTDGDVLGIIDQSQQLLLWDANSRRKSTVDMGLRDSLTCLVWAKNTSLLAVGTAKGNVSIYNHNIFKRVPIIGKHSKKITCGCWNAENLLALGSEDKTLSISNAEGDTLRVVALRAEPSEVQFSEMKLDERQGIENTVSLIVGKRTLYLYNMLDPENPIELAFQQHYGLIVKYEWFGDGYILLGFSSGYFIAISTHIKEVGQELFQVRNHKNVLSDIAICNSIGEAASCGDNSVKIHNIANLQETSSVLSLEQETGVERIGWSSDGQLFAVCTRNGSVNVYVSHMPSLNSVCGPRIAVLSSLAEVSLYNYVSIKSKMNPIPITLEIEPNFIGVGQYHLAAGMNNRAWFYDLTKPQVGKEDAPLLIRERQYLGIVNSIKLNVEYASVFYEGKIQLHMIEQPEVQHEERESMLFPQVNAAVSITCHVITTDFLIYGTDMGQVQYFCIEEWGFANEFKHSSGIVEIFVDPAGTRLVFLDVKSKGFVYNAVSNEVVSIPELPVKVTGVLWDNNITDRNVFTVYDEREIYTYYYNRHSVFGPSVEFVGKTSMVSNHLPLMLDSGEVVLATPGGQLTQLTLTTHEGQEGVIGIVEKDIEVLKDMLRKQLLLHRYSLAWDICQILKSKESWKSLAEHALKYMEIDTALRAYTQVEDLSMVISLREVLHTEDNKLLAGYLAMFMDEYDLAQKWFLGSISPSLALEMRRDLLHWDEALKLSKKFAPHEVPFISREYAQQLEFTGNYSESYLHYEKGIQDTISTEHGLICKSGIARTSIHCGNYKQGISTSLEINDKQLFRECAAILEANKQYADAAFLFQKGDNFEKAASNYIRLKDWKKVGEILPNITSSKVHVQYGRAKESEGRYQDAVDAYYAAKDFESVIRLQLDYLNRPEAAVQLVQETKSVEGSKMVARFFQRLNDYSSAIRFLILSHCIDEAFDLAKKHGQMQLYGETLLNSLTTDEIRPQAFSSLGLYFEKEGNYLLAGKYFYHAKEYSKAMKYLLHAAKSNVDENEAITIAVDVVASSNDETLVKTLIEYLLGEKDGLPKDPKYLFRLYMARKQYKEASKCAIIIANEEQVNGNYRNAHDILFSMYQELRGNDISIPQEMQFSLMLLHSYILVRLHVRRGDHMKGARMLVRVANNISKFPSHVVPILTSTVIECHRAGLRNAAYGFATMLIQNSDYRKQIDPKYAKKIEGIVRRPPRNGKADAGDPAEPLTPCPYCGNTLPETDISCSGCSGTIPFCIATGRHVVKSDFTVCPACDFPAIRSEFLEILEPDGTCPMCNEKVGPQKLAKIENVTPYLNLK